MNESFEKDITWNSAIYLHGDEQERFEETVKIIPQNCSSLLDVGAGNGAFLNFVEKSNLTIQTKGVEYSASGIKNKVCKSEIIQGSIDDLKLANQSFECVSALEVIEHLPVGIYEKGLAELERVATKYILISVPYKENRVNVTCPNCSCSFNPNTHVRSFDEMKMKNLFKDFELESLQALGNKREMYFGKYRRLAKSLFGDKRFPAHCVCPLCFYSKDDAKKNIAIESVSKKDNQKLYIKIIKQIFFYNSPRWFLAVYKRKNYL